MSIPMEAGPVSRRQVLLGAGSITFALGLGLPATRLLAQLDAAQALPVTAFVGIEPGGRITILYAKAEMGQGVLTGLPLIIAEFMDARWADVTVERAAGVGPIGNQNTIGSNSTSGQWNALRDMGLQVKAVLLENAARQLGVSVSELTTEPSVVIHAPSGRRLAYGDIVAAGAMVPDPLPVVATAQRDAATDPAAFRLIGTDVARLDVPSKTDGTAVFGIDVELPGMLHGAMVRPPVQGETAVSVDAGAARAMLGVHEVVVTPEAVGIVADSLMAARRAVAALEVEWTQTAEARAFSSEDALESGRARLAANPLPDAFKGAARVVSLDFRTHFVAHACMEPMSATVRHNPDGSFDVWVGTQNPGNVVAACRRAAGVATDDAGVAVRIHVTLLGGGFGRRIESEHVTDAAYLARAVTGRPVKVVWTREDDLRFDPFRPLTVMRVEAGLDEAHDIVAWRHQITTQAYAVGTPSSTVASTPASPPAMDFIVAGGSGNPYGLAPAQYTYMPTGIKVGAWRAIGAAYQKWPAEAMIDVIADIRGQDPLALRYELLDAVIAAGQVPGAEARTVAAANNARQARRILQIVAEMAGYDAYRATPGRALGIGYSDALGSRTACIADVSADRSTGDIRIHTIWCAIDCGLAVLPRHVEADTVGSIVFAINTALHEHVPIVNGVPQVANFVDYRILRLRDLPQIKVRVAPRGGANPSGVGEAGTPPATPAIANASRRALGGVHVGLLPMLPEKVRAAVAAAAG